MSILQITPPAPPYRCLDIFITNTLAQHSESHTGTAPSRRSNPMRDGHRSFAAATMNWPRRCAPTLLIGHGRMPSTTTTEEPHRHVLELLTSLGLRPSTGVGRRRASADAGVERSPSAAASPSPLVPWPRRHGH
jgi:hypothetical protein